MFDDDEGNELNQQQYQQREDSVTTVALVMGAGAGALFTIAIWAVYHLIK